MILERYTQELGRASGGSVTQEEGEMAQMLQRVVNKLENSEDTMILPVAV